MHMAAVRRRPCSEEDTAVLEMNFKAMQGMYSCVLRVGGERYCRWTGCKGSVFIGGHSTGWRGIVDNGWMGSDCTARQLRRKVWEGMIVGRGGVADDGVENGNTLQWATDTWKEVVGEGSLMRKKRHKKELFWEGLHTEMRCGESITGRFEK